MTKERNIARKILRDFHGKDPDEVYEEIEKKQEAKRKKKMARIEKETEKILEKW